ncbi:similar to Saccharomyces cerevisiae YIL097W FYV10 Protein of unknown function, required for survival upon exposure to K1 killer toxin [Maudiozyma saulgeensis]|uniref:Uncharacterized protein n=1 Tax=Maudiozyma saulgeensis TaxID=1789683 RepID=A0A1X7R4T1_9SACH|nr:similar to Saccharomyces cerevisiae YIL097W FYV10 Protein of unknown function, required for survival upon exposure to K1 killer toxin [Kazachstania saulgeensis]
MDHLDSNDDKPGFKYFDSFMALNESSFTIPFSLLNANLRQHEIYVEQETNKLKQTLKDINDMITTGTIDGEEQALVELNTLIKNVTTFEKQLHLKVEKEGALLKRIKRRAAFYNEMNDNYSKGDNISIIDWYQKYTNLLIADYLIRNCTLEQQQHIIGETGDKDICNPGVLFLKQQHMEDLLDTDILIGANTISTALTSKHDLKALMEWIRVNRQRLLKRKSPLEFKANFQHYIELLLRFDLGGAIHCLQTCLFAYVGDHFDEVTGACGLLVYMERCVEQVAYNEKIVQNEREDRNISYNEHKSGTVFTDQNEAYRYFFNRAPPMDYSQSTNSKNNINATNIQHLFNAKNLEKYTTLLDQNSWLKLNELFLEEYYSMYKIPRNDPLLIYISMGISAMKTKECLHNHPSIDPRYDVLEHYSTVDKLENPCPVCSKHFAPLSEKLPYAHHTESKLFENPVMLPSGNVFDSSRLKLLAKTLRKKGIVKLNRNEVIDPIKKTVFNESDFITMYPT